VYYDLLKTLLIYFDRKKSNRRNRIKEKRQEMTVCRRRRASSIMRSIISGSITAVWLLHYSCSRTMNSAACQVW